MIPTRSIIASLAFGGVILCGLPVVHAQSNQETKQTDQSEEDWRKSQRKSGSEDPVDIFSSTSGTGFGEPLSPLEPIDRLPEESKRHLSKQRAIAIAGMGPDDNLEDIDYEPSDAAKKDPVLAADEQAAWEDMVEALGEGGEPDDGTRPGDELEELTGEQADNSQPPASQGNSEQSETAESGPAGSTAQGEAQRQPQDRSIMRGGSAASASDILKRMRGQSGQSTQGSQDQASQSQATVHNSQSDAAAMAEGPDASGASGQQGQTQGQSSDGETMAAGPQSESGAQQAGSAQTASSTIPPLPKGPLSGPVSQSPQVGTTGSTSSASDYLKTLGGSTK